MPSVTYLPAFCFVQAADTEREQLSERVLMRDGIKLCTLWYRAPEILYGDQKYSFAVDSWSLGLVLAELVGFDFHKGSKSTRHTQIDYSVAVFQQLGTPTTERLTKLPHWPDQPPQFHRKPWACAVWYALGLPGVSMLDNLLLFDGSLRMGVAAAAAHDFASPERFQLGGRYREGCGFVPAASPAFEGVRHKWNVLEGSVATEVVHWLQADPVLQPDTDEYAALDISFDARRAYVKCEEGRKFALWAYRGFFFIGDVRFEPQATTALAPGIVVASGLQSGQLRPARSAAGQSQACGSLSDCRGGSLTERGSFP